MRRQKPFNRKVFQYSIRNLHCDMQNHIFFIAFVVVESENKESWDWFLVQLPDEIVDMERDVIISDRQK